MELRKLLPFKIIAGLPCSSILADSFYQIIAVITPYIVDKDKGNMGSKVFFVWGSTCTFCLLFAYFFVPETKGLSLEQVDRMLEETTPRTSGKWKPHNTYANDMRMAEKTTETVSIAEKERI